MSEKKLYYKYQPNNGEPWIIDPSLANLSAMIEAEFLEIRKEGDEKDVELTLTFVWLTDKEFSELPEAY